MQDDEMQDYSLQDNIYKMTVFKTVQFARKKATSGSVKSKKRINLKTCLPLLRVMRVK